MADTRQFWVRLSYLALQAILVVLLILYVAIAGWALVNSNIEWNVLSAKFEMDELKTKTWIAEIYGYLPYPAVVVPFGLLLFGMVLRAVDYGITRLIAGDFAHEVQNHYNTVMHEISDCEKKIGKRQDVPREPEMSEHWVQILLWNVLRLRDADRYASITAWKMGASRRNIWASFLLVQIAILVGAASLILSVARPDPVLGVMYLIGGYLFLVISRRRRSASAAPIRKATHGLSIAKPFSELGECVRGIVVRAKASERKQT